MTEKGQKKRRTWDLGNTTIRNPARIKAGLEVIGREMEGKTWPTAKEFQTALHEALKAHGVIKSSSDTEKDSSGRKWLSGPKQLGFLTVSGRKEPPGVSLTPAGRALAERSIPESDIFLRQLLKYRLPNFHESSTHLRENYDIHPLWYFTKLLYDLQFRSEQPQGLNKDEIALFVVTCIQYEKSAEYLRASLEDFRREYASVKGMVPKNQVVAKYLALVKTELHITQQDETLWDYADSSIRYLSQTGLFSIRGERIWIDDTKKTLAEFVIDHARSIAAGVTPENFGDLAFPVLPSEDRDYLTASIRNLSSIGLQEQLPLDIPQGAQALGTAQLRRVEESLEEQLRARREEKFAAEQSGKIPEIAEDFEKIMSGRFLGGDIYKPAFYEWTIWKGFLAMGGLVNPVHSTRRFPIDSSIHPTHTAKAGHADMLFEYEDLVITSEATTATGENQWSMEAEPVSRHAKDEMLKTRKPVLCVFIAPSIALNTYQNFLDCRLYLHKESEEPVRIDIVPLTHRQFCRILRIFEATRDRSRCIALLKGILAAREGNHAKAWMREIDLLLPADSDAPSLFEGIG